MDIFLRGPTYLFQDVLANDDIKLDNMFLTSFVRDIVKVTLFLRVLYPSHYLCDDILLNQSNYIAGNAVSSQFSIKIIWQIEIFQLHRR